MKKAAAIALVFVLGLAIGISGAVEVSVFGPKQYIRTSGAPDVFNDSFGTSTGAATLIVTNGTLAGNNRIEDAVSSATVSANGVQIFGPSDFNQNAYLLEAPIELLEGNQIAVELNSKPDSYITVEIIQDIAPAEVTLSADPETIILGASSTLTWISANAISCTIEPDVGPVDLNGSISVSPVATTTYTITATGAGGAQATSTATVTVLQPPTVDISANPVTIFSGQEATLSWTSTDAFSATIDQGIGSVDVNGSTIVSPGQSTTYSLTVTGPAGSVSASLQVEVIAPPQDVELGVGGDGQQGGDGVIGDSICILYGNALEQRTDLVLPTPNSFGLIFAATYNSQSATVGAFGYGWTHSYSATLDPAYEIAGQIFLKIIDETGRAAYFQEETAGFYQGALKEKTHVNEISGEYVWQRQDGIKYGFSATGALSWIDDTSGNRLQLSYDAQTRLQSVTDQASGRSLTFIYNPDSLIASIAGPVTAAVPSGIWLSYGYDTNQNLTTVTYADGSGFSYGYSATGDTHNLIEKRDLANHLLRSWGYDTQDRSDNYSNIDGQGVTVNYVNDNQVQVTDAYGTVRTYDIVEIDGHRRIAGMQGLAGAPYAAGSIVRWEYDDSKNLTEVETAGGAIHRYQNYDSRGLPGTVIMASGSAEERTIDYSYHPQLDVPLTRTEPSVLGTGDKTTIWDYDDDGNQTPNENPTDKARRIIEQGFTKDQAGQIVAYEYIATYTYDTRGLVTSIDGPLAGTVDLTTLDYDSLTGNLLSVTRPLIGTTSYGSYDAAGQLGQTTDVNAEVQTYAYDARGRLIVITHQADGSSQTFTYNTAGKVESVTDEDGAEKVYYYDTTHGRLETVADMGDNYILHNYDAQGNLIERGIWDSNGTANKSKKKWYYQAHADFPGESPDIPGLLWKKRTGDRNPATYGYDADGAVNVVSDPEGNQTTYQYDALKRIKKVIQPGAIETSYTYDDHGNLASVTDGKANVTAYIYDDMGRAIETNSPDGGITSYTYDGAGNLIRKTDANSITVQYEYDDLNRITAARFPDASQDIIYTYDQGPNGIGRLTAMADPSGTTTHGYDSRGRLTVKESVVNGISFPVSRTFSPGGRLLSFDYAPGTDESGVYKPAGRTISLERYQDPLQAQFKKLKKVTTAYEGNTVTLWDNLVYDPFGAASGLELGSGGVVANQSGTCACLESINPGQQMEQLYTYDNNGNLTGIQAANTPWLDRTYGYDGLNRLKTAIGSSGSTAYTYDDVGNMTSRDVDGQIETFTYQPGSNQLAGYAYDDNGNITNDGAREFFYNQNNRLVRVEEAFTILGEYTYNGLGQRVLKLASGTGTIFLYDFDGNIIAEATTGGQILKEHLYVNGSRVGMIDVFSSTLYYYHNNFLGTPVFMTDATGKAVWRAEYWPFGEATIHPTSSIENNFRFWGQYYDDETGLHYNYHRYYDPRTGRYLTPDPIGLAGGINLYLYASANPINPVDPYGLFDGRQFAYNAYHGQVDAALSQFESIQSMATNNNPLAQWALSWQVPLLANATDAFGGLLEDSLFGDSGECGEISTDSAGYLYGKGVVIAASVLAGSKGTTKFSPSTVRQFFGKGFPTKLNRGGLPQPYDPTTGRYLAYSTNSGLKMSPVGRFTAGFGQGWAVAKGASGGTTPIGRAGNIGYTIGYSIGSIF